MFFLRFICVHHGVSCGDADLVWILAVHLHQMEEKE